MPKTNNMREKLKALKLFGEFTDTEREEFLELAECAQFKTGDRIVRQDERGDCMYVILEGTVKVNHQKQGRSMELATLGAGDFFGELALVDEGPRSADVVAASDCTMLRVPQSVVRALAGVYPGAAFKLLIAVGRVLVERLRKGNQKYIDSLLAAAAGGR